jgi:hypothetical protein
MPNWTAGGAFIASPVVRVVAGFVAGGADFGKPAFLSRAQSVRQSKRPDARLIGAGLT